MDCKYCDYKMMLEDTYEDDLKTRTRFFHCINVECINWGGTVDVSPEVAPQGMLQGQLVA